MDPGTLFLVVTLIATLPIWIGVANFNLVATLLGLLFVGLAFAVGFSFFIWAGVAFWVVGLIATLVMVKSRQRHRDEERRHRELMAAIRAGQIKPEA